MRSTPVLPGGSVRPKARAACACRGASSAGAAPASGRRWSAPARCASARTCTGSAARARQLDHRARVAVPAGLAGGHGVVGAAPARVGAARARIACAVTSASSSAPVGAPIWSSITCSRSRSGGQPEHRAREVAAARRVDPAGAQDQVAAAAGADRLLAFELGAAVDAERAGGRVFVRAAAAAAVEHVVGAVVHQPGAERRGLARQHAPAPRR